MMLAYRSNAARPSPVPFRAVYSNLAIASLGEIRQMKRYIAANFAGLISRLSADLLFGEEPECIAAQEVAARLRLAGACVLRGATESHWHGLARWRGTGRPQGE